MSVTRSSNHRDFNHSVTEQMICECRSRIRKLKTETNSLRARLRILNRELSTVRQYTLVRDEQILTEVLHMKQMCLNLNNTLIVDTDYVTGVNSLPVCPQAHPDVVNDTTPSSQALCQQLQDTSYNNGSALQSFSSNGENDIFDEDYFSDKSSLTSSVFITTERDTWSNTEEHQNTFNRLGNSKDICFDEPSQIATTFQEEITNHVSTNSELDLTSSSDELLQERVIKVLKDLDSQLDKMELLSQSFNSTPRDDQCRTYEFCNGDSSTKSSEFQVEPTHEAKNSVPVQNAPTGTTQHSTSSEMLKYIITQIAATQEGTDILTASPVNLSADEELSYDLYHDSSEQSVATLNDVEDMEYNASNGNFKTEKFKKPFIERAANWVRKSLRKEKVKK